MSESPTVVFRAKSPSAVDEWEAERARREEVFRDHLDYWAERLDRDIVARRSFLGSSLIGYAPSDPDETPLPGFRRDSKTSFMLPAKRTTEGKTVARQLGKIEYVRGRPPGLGGMVFGAGSMQPFSIRRLGCDWYAYLTMPLDGGAPAPMHFNRGGVWVGDVDLELWEPVKLSEWHLAVEQEPIT